MAAQEAQSSVLLASRIREELATYSIRRVVIDSLAEMVFAARESDRFPAYARSLTGIIRAAGASLLITSETATLGPSPEPIGGVMLLFHNVILLRYIELNSATAGRHCGPAARRAASGMDAMIEWLSTHPTRRLTLGAIATTGVVAFANWPAVRPK